MSNATLRERQLLWFFWWSGLITVVVSWFPVVPNLLGWVGFIVMMRTAQQVPPPSELRALVSRSCSVAWYIGAAGYLAFILGGLSPLIGWAGFVMANLAVFAQIIALGTWRPPHTQRATRR